jgi:pyruvate formate lyase activating enzyme
MEVTGTLLNIQRFSINDGPGIRTTVFFKGCPLCCRWCSNPESQNRYAALADAMEDEAYRGRAYTVGDVMAQVRKDEAFYRQSGGGMTLSGGEPLEQAGFAAALADAARAEGIHVAVETTGYANPERFQAFLPHVDLLLFDVKHADRERHRAGTGVYNDVILKNLRFAAASGVDTIARIPVIPGFNDDIETARAMARMLADIGVKTVHLLPFHQFGEAKYDRLGVCYEMRGRAQLHPEMLEPHRRAFVDAGLDCSFQ